MMRLPSKQALKDELVQAVSKDLHALELAQKATVEGATHAEAKAENDKDTRSLEQTYLARGQAKRVEELRSGLALVSVLPVKGFAPQAPVALGALVTAQDDDGSAVTILVAPYGGGYRLAGGRVQVVTPGSPLGKAMLGRTAGEVCEVPHPRGKRELELVAVA